MTKVALIWGVAGGIGRALARKLKDEGWQVIGVSRQGNDLAGVADYAFAADVADPFAVQRAVLAAGRRPARHICSSTRPATSRRSRPPG